MTLCLTDRNRGRAGTWPCCVPRAGGPAPSCPGYAPALAPPRCPAASSVDPSRPPCWEGDPVFPPFRRRFRRLLSNRNDATEGRIGEEARNVCVWVASGGKVLQASVKTKHTG